MDEEQDDGLDEEQGDGVDTEEDEFDEKLEDDTEEEDGLDDEEEEDGNHIEWWSTKTVYDATTPFAHYGEDLPAPWKALAIASDLGLYQRYMHAAFTGQASFGDQVTQHATGFLEHSHDWTTDIQNMMGAVDRCSTIFDYDSATMRPFGGKKPTVTQAIVNRLAEFCAQTDARGFLAWHSVGSGKTISSALILDAFFEKKRDVFFVTSTENLANVSEMLSDLPLVSSKSMFRDLADPDTSKRLAQVSANMQKRTPPIRLTPKRGDKLPSAMERRRDFAQGYQDFACALNVNDGNPKFNGRLVGKGYFWDGEVAPDKTYGTSTGRAFRWPKLRSYYDDEGTLIRGDPIAFWKKKVKNQYMTKNPYIDEEGNYRPLRDAIIVLDEVQNILNASDKKEIFSYRMLYEEILKEPTCKVFLLTATPGDTPDQMCKIMNLLVRPPNYIPDLTAFVRANPDLYMSASSFFDQTTGQLKDGYESVVQNNIADRGILVSFLYANEDKGVFSQEKCQDRDSSARCRLTDVTYDVTNHTLELPDPIVSHIRVLAPMGDKQQAAILRSKSGNRQAVVGKKGEIAPGKKYIYEAYETNEKAPNFTGKAHYDPKWHEYRDQCSQEGSLLPICQTICKESCDEPTGQSESQFMVNMRRYSSMVWDGRSYRPPDNLHTMNDVYHKVSSKVAAFLAIVKRFPNEKHALIVSNYAKKSTGTGYKTQVAYALHQVLGKLDKNILGFAWAPLCRETGTKGDNRWDVGEIRHQEGTKQYALYMNQMPTAIKDAVARTFNNFEYNFGGSQRLNQNGTVRMDQGPGCNLIITNRIEGLSLMGVRHIHLFDAPVSTKNYFQSIGRGIRLCSHRGMTDQSTVVYEYFSDLPERLVDTYDKCVETKAVLQEFMGNVRSRLAAITSNVGDPDAFVFYTTPPYVEYSNGSRVSIPQLDSTFSVDGISGFVGGFAGDLMWLNGKEVQQQRIQVSANEVKAWKSGHGFKLWEQIGYRVKDATRYFDERQFTLLGTLLRQCCEDMLEDLEHVKRESQQLTHCNRDEVRSAIRRLNIAEAKVRALRMALSVQPSRKSSISLPKKDARAALKQAEKEYKQAAGALQLSQTSTSQCVFAPAIALQDMEAPAATAKALLLAAMNRRKVNPDFQPVVELLLKGAETYVDLKDYVGDLSQVPSNVVRGGGWGAKALFDWAKDRYSVATEATKNIFRSIYEGLFGTTQPSQEEEDVVEALTNFGFDLTQDLSAESQALDTILATKDDHIEFFQPSDLPSCASKDAQIKTWGLPHKGPGKTKKAAVKLSFTPDHFLTKYASERYKMMYQLTKVVMGAAVDCLLLKEFHSQEGAMYPQVKCLCES